MGDKDVSQLCNNRKRDDISVAMEWMMKLHGRHLWTCQLYVVQAYMNTLIQNFIKMISTLHGGIAPY